mgnify:CR=1 FL=1
MTFASLTQTKKSLGACLHYTYARDTQFKTWLT